MISAKDFTTAQTNPYIEEVLALSVDDRGYVAEQDRNAIFRRQRVKLENRQCFDCHNPNPAWISLTFGVFVCLTCSGNHRQLGTHISFVRSCELDRFTPDQLVRMELGGNGKALMFFKAYGSTKPDYRSKLAAKYKALLDKACQKTLDDVQGERQGSLDLKDEARALKSATIDSTQQETEQETQKPHLSKADVEHLAPIAPTTASTLPSVKPPPISKASHIPWTGSQDRNPSSWTTDRAEDSATVSVVHAPAASGFGGGKGLKAKKLDIDFDFEEALEEATTYSNRAIQYSSHTGSSVASFKAPTFNIPPTVTATTNLHSASNDATVGLLPIASRYGAVGEASSKSEPGNNTTISNDFTVSSKYAKAKAISSIDFLESLATQQTPAERMELEARMRRFNDCKAISSDAFYAGDPSFIALKASSGGDSSAHLAQLSRQAREGIQLLASGAQQPAAVDNFQVPLSLILNSTEVAD